LSDVGLARFRASSRFARSHDLVLQMWHEPGSADRQ
jgi:hypothetical protein